MKPIILAVALAVLSIACQPTTDKEISLGEPIRHDDFFYSATHVLVQDSIGTTKPRGRFWIVTLQVNNQAKRVDHPWTNSVAFITDTHGHTYTNQPHIQQQLNALHPFGWQQTYITSAGHTDTSQLVFDLPKSFKKPFLQYQGELLMGDVLDGQQFVHTKVRLF